MTSGFIGKTAKTELNRVIKKSMWVGGMGEERRKKEEGVEEGKE